MNIYEKLMKVQASLKAPKGQFNSFGNYRYRSCEDIVEAVKPLLSEVGAVLTLSDSLELIGDRFYVKATATLLDGEGIVQTYAYAREDEIKKGMDGSQITGAASSYARKYALNGLFAIDDTKDADATNTHGNEIEAPKKPAKKVEPDKKPEAEKKVNKDNVQALILKMASKNVTEKQVLDVYKVKKLEDLTLAQWNQAMRKLDKN